MKFAVELINQLVQAFLAAHDTRAQVTLLALKKIIGAMLMYATHISICAYLCNRGSAGSNSGVFPFSIQEVNVII